MEFKTIERYPLFKVSRAGIVRNQYDQTIDPTIDRFGHLDVEVYADRPRHSRMESVAKLVLETFVSRPTLHPYFTSVNFKDGNKLNCNLDNLEWDELIYKPARIPGITASLDEFFDVPGYPGIRINGRGIVVDCDWNPFRSFIVTSTSAGDYRSVRIPSPSGSGTTVIGLHNLLGLTFLEHPRDVSDLLVNHIDGNPSNNTISNLEWTTYAGNILHAYATGLRSQNKPVLAMNISTRAVERFFSTGDFLRNKNIVDTGSLWDRIRYGRPIMPYNGYYVKLETDDRPWPDPDHQFGRKSDEGIPILVKNMETGEEVEYESYSDAARAEKITTSDVGHLIRKDAITPYRHRMYKKKGDSRPWPTPKEIGDPLDFDSNIPLIAYNVSTQELRELFRLAPAAKLLGCQADTLSINLRKFRSYTRGDWTVTVKAYDYE